VDLRKPSPKVTDLPCQAILAKGFAVTTVGLGTGTHLFVKVQHLDQETAK